MLRALRVVLCVGAFAAVAHAQSNYQPSPVAPHAMGMGGAGAASVDGAAGMYYTPGSLAFGERGELSVSGNLYGIVGGKVGQSFGPGTSETYLTIAAVPTNVSGERHGFKLGRFETSDRWGFGINVVSPINLKAASISASKDQAALVLRNNSEFVYTVYIGFAYRVRHNVGFGMAIVLAGRQFQSSFDATVDRPGRYLQASQSLTAYTVGGALAFGVRAFPTSRLSLGLGLHLPLINLFGWGDARERGVVVEFGPNGSDVTSFEKFGRKRTLDARYSLPLRITAGVAYTVPRRWAIAFDLHIWTPHEYNAVLDRNTKEILSHIDLDWTVNINVGVAWWLRQRWPLRFGFFTDRSPTRQVFPGELASVRQDLYGATASFGFRGTISDNEVGILASGGPTLTGAVDLASGTLEETRARGYQWRVFITYATQLHYK